MHTRQPPLAASCVLVVASKCLALLGTSKQRGGDSIPSSAKCLRSARTLRTTWDLRNKKKFLLAALVFFLTSQIPASLVAIFKEVNSSNGNS